MQLIRHQEDDTPLARAQRLLGEARLAAREQVHLLEAAMNTVAALSAQVADGGDIYPPGVRDLCRRLADDTSSYERTLNALSTRLMDAPPQRR
jgi:nitrate reductase assembly molybdenum cofactor insertion protein NarJ